MSVPVSLLRLVCVPNTRHLWPEEFAALVATCEADPDDRTAFGVAADWCDENDEPHLGEAFRWMFKRPDVMLHRSTEYYSKDSWEFRLLPTGLAGDVPTADNGATINRTTVAGMMADLAYRLKKLREILA